MRNTVNAIIKKDIIIKNNYLDIFVYNKKWNEIILIEVKINNLELLIQIENEKSRIYDLLAK